MIFWQTTKTPMRNCYKCDVPLNDENWSKGQQKQGTRICKPCARAVSLKWGRENRDKISANRKAWYRNNIEKTLWTSAKKRAEKKSLPFDIEVSDISIPETCPVLNIPIFCDFNRFNSPSLDKVRPELGYVKGNIMVMSTRANILKNNATIEELEAVVAWLNRNTRS